MISLPASSVAIGILIGILRLQPALTFDKHTGITTGPAATMGRPGGRYTGASMTRLGSTSYRTRKFLKYRPFNQSVPPLETWQEQDKDLPTPPVYENDTHVNALGNVIPRADDLSEGATAAGHDRHWVHTAKHTVLPAAYAGLMDGITDEVCKVAVNNLVPHDAQVDGNAETYKWCLRMLLSDMITQTWLPTVGRLSRVHQLELQARHDLADDELWSASMKTTNSASPLDLANPDAMASSDFENETAALGILQSFRPPQVQKAQDGPLPLGGITTTAPMTDTEAPNELTVAVRRATRVIMRLVVMPIVMHSLVHSVNDFAVHYLLDTVLGPLADDDSTT